MSCRERLLSQILQSEQGVRVKHACVSFKGMTIAEHLSYSHASGGQKSLAGDLR